VKLHEDEALIPIVVRFWDSLDLDQRILMDLS